MTNPVLFERLTEAADAAGLAYPESGEGIRPATESGWWCRPRVATSAAASC